MKRLTFLPFAVCLCSVLSAQGPTKVELIGTYDRLTNGFKDWKSLRLTLANTSAPRRTVYGGVLSTERFGISDLQLTLGGYMPIDKQLTSLVEVSVSPTHRVLPGFASTFQLHKEVGNGWVISGGLNHTRYSSDASTSVTAGAERYFGRYRAAYNLSVGWARKAGATFGNRMSFTEYMTDRTSYTLALGFGKEVESINPGAVVRSDVFGISLDARISMGKQQSLRLGIGHHRQGTLYQRDSISLGYQHEF